MKFSPFSCPIFLGHLKARGRCSQGERVLYGRDLGRSGGTGKAEAAKLPGAGIGPKQCPGKCATEKGLVAEISENREEGAHLHKTDSANDAKAWSMVVCGSTRARLTNARSWWERVAKRALLLFRFRLV